MDTFKSQVANKLLTPKGISPAHLLELGHSSMPWATPSVSLLRRRTPQFLHRYPPRPSNCRCLSNIWTVPAPPLLSAVALLAALALNATASRTRAVAAPLWAVPSLPPFPAKLLSWPMILDQGCKINAFWHVTPTKTHAQPTKTQGPNEFLAFQTSFVSFSIYSQAEGLTNARLFCFRIIFTDGILEIQSGWEI